MGLGILLLLASLIASLVIKPPVVTQADFTKAKFKDLQQKKDYLTQQKLEQAKNQKVTWPGDGSQIAPSALDFVTKVAAKHNVKLVGFRPQRAVDAGLVSQLPFLINMEGAFKDVMAAEADIESPASRMVVENYQIGSSQESTDQVTGTIGVEAYTIDPIVVKTTTKSTVTVPAGAANVKS